MADSTRDASDGEPAARREWFRETILPLEPRLRLYVRHLRRGNTDIDDLVHDTLIRAITTQNWREVSRPWAFLRSIARNLLIDSLRRQKVVTIELTGEWDSNAFADDAPGPEAELLARDELKRLAEAIEGLPPQQRKVFVMRKVQDLNIPTIADRLGLSVSTVEKHLVRALRACALKLRGADEPDDQ
ncbi:MAG TPA: RNA polymerase sigma factor [Caulobacteraceae bacterium]